MCCSDRCSKLESQAPLLLAVKPCSEMQTIKPPVPPEENTICTLRRASQLRAELVFESKRENFGTEPTNKKERCELF